MKPVEHNHRRHSWVNTLYVALTPGQLAELIKTDWRGLSPAFADQRHVYLKLARDYAELIARHWHAAQYGAGYVARLRVPVEELAGFNRQIVGRIQVIAAFAPARPPAHDVPGELLSLH